MRDRAFVEKEAGRTPLHIACSREGYDVVSILNFSCNSGSYGRAPVFFTVARYNLL